MERDRLYVDHILEAIRKIEDYTHDLSARVFKDKKNEMVQDAVVRELEIIGEAVGALSASLKKNFPYLPWRKIRAMRNKLVHEYFSINLTIVWNTLKKSVPLLKKSMKEIEDQIK